ncbi:RNA pseudouridine synthase [Candidatus Wolfebacteria bacterium]|nr:MAG: RNA pseudouridine synthase [Candidatus Wolfebacteria bacterium]
MKKVEIIYEDTDVVVVNKPAGLVVHKDGKRDEETLADWVLGKYPETKGVGESMILSDGTVIDRPGIVHRLDRDTTGVMIVAKTQDAFEFLKEQFQNREVQKTYLAFVYGNVKEDDGVIDRPIARSKSNFRLWSAQRGGRGKARDAITEYKVEKRSKEVTFIEVMPKTGRTHQIRTHFKAINHPVVSDALYAPKRDAMLGFERLALHAHKLAVALPNGKNETFEARLPDDFVKALEVFPE